MINLLFESPLAFLIVAFGLLLAIAIHEFSHALVADRLGDPTARLLGRVTLNPLAHLDPLGTVLILFVGFGWGKPVPFDPFNLQNPRRDSALISLAGPASNILLALVLSVLYKIVPPDFSIILRLMIQTNLMLALFNLIPIHPLDGFKIVAGFLPSDKADQWDSLSSYGIYFLMLILLPLTPNGSLVSLFLSPALDFILRILIG